MRFPLWLVGLCIVCACSGATTLSDSTHCVPGRQVECACANGASSIQVCGQNATYGACLCSTSSPGPNGSSTGAGGGHSGKPSAGGSSSFEFGGSSAIGSAGSTATGLIDYHYGDVSPCDAHPNSLLLDGEGGDYIHPGQDFITVAKFSSQSSSEHISFNIEPSGAEHGLWWSVDFSSEKLGTSLGLGEYLNAERYPFQTYLKPGIDVSGDGRGCNTETGKFLVTDVYWVGGTLIRFSASFEQHCEGGSAALRGCVHYDSGLTIAPSSGGAAGTGGASGSGGASISSGGASISSGGASISGGGASISGGGASISSGGASGSASGSGGASAGGVAGN